MSEYMPASCAGTPGPDRPDMIGDVEWRDRIDLMAHRALVEIRKKAESARRSLGQRIRWARVEVKRVVG